MAIAKLAAPKRETSSAGRFYTWKGETFPSVTTALQIISKPFLTKWAAKVVAEEAERLADDLPHMLTVDREGTLRDLKAAPDRARDRAANLGTTIHEAAEAYILGGMEPVVSTEAAPYLAAFREFLSDLRPTYEAVEATVYSRKHGYAGTADAFLRLGGEPVVLDYKTGKKLYPETALQLAAYRYGEFVGLNDGSEVPVPAVEAGYILHLKPNAWTLQRVRVDEEVFAGFVSALRLWKYEQTTKKSVFVKEGAA